MTHPLLPDPTVREEGRFAVFVPGLMGAGILLSALIVLGDLARKVLPSGANRRAAQVAEGVHGVVAGAATVGGVHIHESGGPRRGLRSRSFYAANAVGALLTGLLLLRVGVDGYLSDGVLKGNLWPLGFGIGLGTIALLAAVTWLVIAIWHTRLARPIRRAVEASPAGRLLPPPEDYAVRAAALLARRPLEIS